MTTQIAFHFNAPDKLYYACRVARKAQRQGQRLVLTAPQQTLALLDEMLWNLSPSDFIPHCSADASAELLKASPIVLAPDPRQAPQHRQLLINLGSTLPLGFERFERLIEIVSRDDEQDRQQARTRWRNYQTSGYTIVRHDLALSAR
ncbi:MAG: DNA polymerase III subunit chi [Giesbergeria sp.]|uniref:DNA polymerase III subunit chi n=1 Tax=Giesbergeria sp. TaxID=2818473 RepID=UPI002603FCB3|nr:DNA polymerase III subunit chi [Giesbergeria sp.]MDD2609747.1 DNA polymerase III subunit chi [Giesbergeria sp.]